MSKREAVIFARNILDLIEDKIYHSELDDIAKKYSGLRISEKLKFINRLYLLLNNLPLALWESDEQRSISLMECIKYMEVATIKDIGESKFIQLSAKISRDEHNFFRENI